MIEIENIAELDINSIPAERKPILDQLTNYIQQEKNAGNPINLNFICTHNSRRSQFSQVWGQFMANKYGIQHVKSESGGVEITACNPRTVASLERSGFHVENPGGENPKYEVQNSDGTHLVFLYSKLFDDTFSPEEKFAAVMTCSHADENCPFIPNAAARIPLNYEDPKAFDDTPDEARMYDERSRQIATELMYVFSRVV